MTAIDHWIPHAQGRMFAREWPAAQAGDAAPPLVLLHDSLGCVALWREFPALLARDTGRRVIAYDRAGFGESDARGARPSLDFIVEEATTWFPIVRRHLGIDRFAVLGHSVGGGMAVNIAARHSDSCDALVTIAAQAFVEDRTVAGLRAARVSFAEPGAMERLERYHGDKAAWVLSAWLDTWLDPAFAHWSLARVLPGVRCLELAVQGQREAAHAGQHAHPAMIARLAGGPARMEILAGLGHVPQRERPEEIARRVATFLSTTGQP